MSRAFVAALLLAVVATGCRNSCQQLCGELEDYATECNYTVPDDATKTCIQDHGRSDTTREEREVCTENGDALRDEWSCEDVGRFMGLE